MTWIIFVAFLTPLLHAAGNIIDAHISNKLFKNYTSIIFYGSLTNVLVIPFLFIFGVPQALAWSIVPALFMVGAIDVFYQIPYYAALRKIDTSVACALFSLGQVFVPVLAWLLVDEKLHFIQYFGFGIIILAGVALNLERGRRFRLNAGFWLMLLVSGLLSLQIVLFKYVLNELDWVSTIFYSTLISTLVALGLLLAKSCRRIIIGDFSAYRRQLKFFLLNEAFYQSGQLPWAFVLSLLPVVVVEGIEATQPIFVLLLGCLLSYFYGKQFKEQLGAREIVKKLFCFILIIIGIILVIG